MALSARNQMRSLNGGLEQPEHCVSLVECKHTLNGKDEQMPREEDGTFGPEHAT